jgi:hypothetical protein
MEQDADPGTAGMRVEARIFLGIAAFLVLATAVYFVTSSEDAGSTMLLLAGGMALIVGGYLAFQARTSTDAAEPGRAGSGGSEEPALEEAYLPHASVWPFALGMGLVVLANGLALGLWAVIPGGLLTAASAWGYARQSRRRD